MSYNPNKHHRKSIRLKGYDYSKAGLYFITICCDDRIYRFGEIVDNKMQLNEYGMIAYNEWIKLTERFSNFELDVFQIMPNHMHGIIALIDVGAGLTSAHSIKNDFAIQNEYALHNHFESGADGYIGSGASPAPTTISDIVGAYKSLVANQCLKIFKSKNEIMGKLWQRNYYEHIIRDERAYNNISNYIINNPLKWPDDKSHQNK